MVKIRLRRTGAKKQPHYRVVVTDSRSPRDGRFLETIGNYNPRTEPPTVEIDAERALYWLGVGAQPSAAVKRMFDKLGVLAQAAAIKKGEVPPAALPPVAKPVVEAEEEEAAEVEAIGAEFEVEEAEEEEEEEYAYEDAEEYDELDEDSEDLYDEADDFDPDIDEADYVDDDQSSYDD